MSKEIWVCGEVLIDLIPRGEKKIAIVGGGPANTAKALALLGFDSYNYWDAIPIGYVKEFNEMINYTINKFKEIPDCDIIINRKDSFLWLI